jgi:hypothetical protein
MTTSAFDLDEFFATVVAEFSKLLPHPPPQYPLAAVALGAPFDSRVAVRYYPPSPPEGVEARRVSGPTDPMTGKAQPYEVPPEQMTPEGAVLLAGHLARGAQRYLHTTLEKALAESPEVTVSYASMGDALRVAVSADEAASGGHMFLWIGRMGIEPGIVQGSAEPQ